MNWFKKLFCEHEYEFVRNIYGDEINWCGGYRSVWRCKKCGKIEYRRYLQTSTIAEKLNKLYTEYYKNKYDNWCSLQADTLNKMLEDMMSLAKNGQCSTDFELICNNNYNDKNYYEKWFYECGLEFESKLNQKEECEQYNKYIFHVKWNLIK